MARTQTDSTGSAGSAAREKNTPLAMLSRPGVLCLLLALAIVAVFWPVRHFEFLNYDDPDYVTDNSRVLQGLTVNGLAWAMVTRHADNWHPLTWLSHMLDVEVFGPQAEGPHIVNLLFHVASTILLFTTLKRLTGACWRSALVAGLFALHPLHVESVAWISERKDVLSTFFFMLTLWAYARYAKGSVVNGQLSVVTSAPGATLDSRRSTLDYILALLFFSLGLMSKSMLVTVPFVLLLLDYWPLRRFSSDSAFGSEPTRREIARSLVVEKLPFFAMSAACSAMTLVAQKAGGTMVSLAGLPPGARMENAFVSFARYVGKTVWPSPLLLPYPHPVHWPWFWVAWGALVTVGGCAAAIALRRRRPFLFTGWFWFFGTLIPVIGLIQVGHQSIADRYTYIPLIGLFLAFTWAAAALAENWRVPRSASAAIAISILFACALRTSDQLRYWRNSETLFRHAIANSDGNYLAHDYLGGYLEAQGRFDPAIAEFQTALGLNPHDAVSYAHLGSCYFSLGNLSEADRNFSQALDLDPLSAGNWINLGTLRFKQGRVSEAEQQFNKALQLEPDSAEGLERLADALCAEQRYSEAIPNYEMALRLRPAEAEVWNRLGNALFRVKRISDASQCYQAALQLKPKSVEFLSNYGAVQFELGRFDEANRSYALALDLNPSNAQAHNNFANVLFRQNRLDAAANEYQRALEINPQLVEALNNLGWLRVQTTNYAAALDCFQRALRIQPRDESICRHQAYVLTQMGRTDEALQAYDRALLLNPNSAEAHVGMGELLARLGRRDEAGRQLSEALRLRPDFEEARKALDALGVSPASPK